MSFAADILRAARAKIADPKHWTRGNFAHDEDGDPVSPTSPDAFKWCSIGAIDAAAPVAGAGLALKYLKKSVFEKHGVDIVADFNDRSEHADVLAAFDRAIDLAEGRS